jgi:DNA polymerase (family 10)
MDKREVARILEDIGTLLELQGESPFKTRAYYTAARVVAGLETAELEALARSRRLTTLKGIGAALADKIHELVTTGRSRYYDALQQQVPRGLLEMLAIPGMGPKKVKAIHDQLGIATVGELEYACHENRLVDLPGFGRKTQANILRGIEHLKQHRGRYLCHEALRMAQPLLEALSQRHVAGRVALAGSLRRRQEVVDRLDLLVSPEQADPVRTAIAQLSGVEAVPPSEPTRLSLRLPGGLTADVHLVSEERFPLALWHLTGHPHHVMALQERARQRGWRLDVDGLWQGATRLPCRDEAELYARLDLCYIPPELREGAGEIEAAERGELPTLVDERDIQGVFHAHSTWSDGVASIEDMALAAQRLGYRYLGLSDHSQSARYAHGLEPERVRQQQALIDRLNAQLAGITILKGSEVDILPDGTLDYPDELLRQFDFVVASVHSRFNMSRQEMTARILKAMQNPYVTMVGHLTGRLLLAREGYDVDVEAVIAEAIRRDVVLELNANPHRLDIDWRYLRQARGQGLTISINPDAHSPEGLGDVSYGVGAARKGWVSAAAVLNARDLPAVRAWLEGRRGRRAGQPVDDTRV